MKSRFRCLSAFLFAIFFVLRVSLAHSQTLDTDSLRKDSRLSTPITLSSPRIYLYDLLSEISRQSGVKLSVDPTDIISGIPLTVSLKQTSVLDVMSGLWSALGYKGATLDWRSRVTNGGAVYYLTANPRYRALPERLIRVMQDALEAQANVMIDLAYMTPERRNSEIPRLSKVMLEETNEMATVYVDASTWSDKFWKQVRLFAEAVPQEQRQAVLRGEEVIIPCEQLSSEWRDFLRECKPRYWTEQPDGTRIEHDDTTPVALHFDANHSFGRNSHNCVKLMFGVEAKNGIDKFSIFGMMDRGLIRRGNADWMLTGDAKSNALATQIVEKPAKGAPTYVPSYLDIVNKVYEFATATPTSFIGVIPDEARTAPASPYGESAKAFLDACKESPYYIMSKWRNGMLLLNHPYWFYGDDAQFNYQSLQQLRIMAKKRNGYFSALEAAQTLSKFTKPQLERLSEEFPVLESVMRWDVFLKFKDQPEVFTENGLAVNGETFSKLRSSLHLENFPPDWRVTALRIFDSQREVDGKEARTFNFSLQTEDGKWKPVHGIHILPRNASTDTKSP